VPNSPFTRRARDRRRVADLPAIAPTPPNSASAAGAPNVRASRSHRAAGEVGTVGRSCRRCSAVERFCLDRARVPRAPMQAIHR
jgi:hypothetical protein